MKARKLNRKQKWLAALVCCLLVIIIGWWLQRTPRIIPLSAVKSISWSSDQAEPPIDHGQLSGEEIGFIIGLLNASQARYPIDEEFRPTYDGAYFIYTTFNIDLYDENVSYKLLWYDCVGFDLLTMDDYHTRLALVKIEDGKEELWSLSPRATRRFRQWIDKKLFDIYNVESE